MSAEDRRGMAVERCLDVVRLQVCRRIDAEKVAMGADLLMGRRHAQLRLRIRNRADRDYCDAWRRIRAAVERLAREVGR